MTSLLHPEYRDLEMLRIMKQHLSPLTIDEVIGHLNMNDAAHDVTHVNAVVCHAEKIADTFPELEWCRDLILVAAFMHDIGSHVDRKNHHTVGSTMAIQLLSRNETAYDQAQIFLIAEAIAQHRASYRGDRISPISLAVAAADRGNFSRPLGELMRAVKTRIGDSTSCSWNDMESAVRHMQEKFATDGYAWKSVPIYSKQLYADNIAGMKAFFDGDGAATMEQLKKTPIKEYSGKLWLWNQPTNYWLASDHRSE